MLLLLSHFSCVQLSATPRTAAHQAPPSMGFSRQEYRSGVPLPSPSLWYRETNKEGHLSTGILCKVRSLLLGKDLFIISHRYQFSPQSLELRFQKSHAVWWIVELWAPGQIT